MPAFVGVLSPANAATSVALDAPITWSATPGAISGIQVTLPELGQVIILSDQPMLDITTLRSTSPFSWPAETAVTYTLVNIGPFSSVNEAAQSGERLFGPLARNVVNVPNNGGPTLVANGLGLGHTLGTNPDPVDVVLTLGEHCYCLRFGGEVTFKPDKKWLAKEAPAPNACP